jgi:transcriptional regulator with XRE-family HTH domain
MTLRNLGSRVKRLRKAKGLTQAELAEKVNVSRAFITLVEAAEKTPSLDTCYRLAKALGVPLSGLLEGSR